jgi:hypothetical protein
MANQPRSEVRFDETVHLPRPFLIIWTAFSIGLVGFLSWVIIQARGMNRLLVGLPLCFVLLLPFAMWRWAKFRVTVDGREIVRRIWSLGRQRERRVVLSDVVGVTTVNPARIWSGHTIVRATLRDGSKFDLITKAPDALISAIGGRTVSDGDAP